MAELRADSLHKQDDVSMTAGEKVTQPQRTDAASTPPEKDDAGPRMTGRVKDAIQQGEPTSLFKAEPNESTGEEVPAIEGLPSDDSAAETEGVEPAPEGTDAQLKVKKKKKKTKKTPKSRRNITGFEGEFSKPYVLTTCSHFLEFYADPPITPAEALEKKKLYDP
jgi:hypothetical protein